MIMASLHIHHFSLYQTKYRETKAHFFKRQLGSDLSEKWQGLHISGPVSDV